MKVVSISIYLCLIFSLILPNLQAMSRKKNIIIEDDYAIYGNQVLSTLKTAYIEFDLIQDIFTLSDFQVQNLYIHGVESDYVFVEVDFFQVEHDSIQIDFNNNMLNASSELKKPVILLNVVFFVPKNIYLRISQSQTNLHISNLYKSNSLSLNVVSSNVFIEDILAINTIRLDIRDCKVKIKNLTEICFMEIEADNSTIDLINLIDCNIMNMTLRQSKTLFEKSNFIKISLNTDKLQSIYSYIVSDDFNLISQRSEQKIFNSEIDNLKIENKNGNISVTDSLINNFDFSSEGGRVSFIKTQGINN